MGAGRTGVVVRKLVAWDTYKVCGWVTDGSRRLTDTIGIVAVIASDGAVLKACTGVAGTVDGIAAPRVAAR